IDADEQQRFVTNGDTAGAYGWASYLTVHGTEANKSADGQFRVDVNQDDLELLYEELQTTGMNLDWASFIVAYRMYGQSNLTDLSGLASSNDADGATAAAPSDAIPLLWTAEALDGFDLTAGAGVQLNQLLDLVDAKVVVGEGATAKTFVSPFVNEPEILAEMLPVLMDLCTTQSNDTLPGRINLNECPAELLLGLNVVDAETMTAIIDARGEGGAGASILGGDASVASRDHETWPLTEGWITLDQMRALLPLVNAGGDVYRDQIIGYEAKTGLFNRVEAVVDATTPDPQLVQYRDLSHLGRGFELSVLGSRTTLDIP
ncbi:MAG: type II secretion system protein GspK, partial [Planctomycetota bacterium]